ncbi:MULTISPECIES: hypothetical protein [unclassified Bradyrhizobium]|uniref:hypothetical protein n=1 Tax=unclassified Bradyrhizobium TaxID=2631580 RepID=UPI001CD472E0|nr:MULTISPECIES: hypothetical protein [unclassified Bradyrhizobium]MCA1386364.1 hypothetical protein [Bradyrhizobium sp. BRP05]MCA1394467.1 hypothetical protein [Bradyrhizobium sp. IC3123]MCA1423960.1 hypothetical protein [Bradyrhizobium sp. BRP23]MCA1431156.1 hypothetical protein [Bradyrhizobium sp. NBAIM16]MCA1480538.1 hypothetical protein [Bradyrhizobium sp. NBAIM08]
MALQIPRSLGILNLERGMTTDANTPAPLRGSLMSSATFDLPIISETVIGAWADIVIPGAPELEPACVAAAKRLVERGAVAISSNCGYFIRHQAAVAAAVDVPVVTSSLLLLPALLRQLPAAAKLAVVVAQPKHLSEDMLGIDDPAARARVVIGGIENSSLVRNENMRPPPRTDIAEIERDVVACTTQLRDSHPDIAVFLFECTGMPLTAPAVRRITGLPVYDITTLCRMTLASVL